MTPERWRQVTEVFHAALGRDRPARGPFLDEACAGDRALRAEVEALLGAHEGAGRFGESPILAGERPGPASDVGPDRLQQKALSHYRNLEMVGKGGMGVVYRARDARLGRDVAIKVLPADRMGDETRRRRFVQEARAASALNHPNIVTIHEIDAVEGIDFIVMEYIRGRGLDTLIPRHGMPLGEALRVAIPIADALARAHGAGIVHRDVKPSNVMVGPDGIVKVLDFGLAKLVGTATAHDTDEGHSTATEGVGPISHAGTIAGTAGYMSPEQATGSTIDSRSDVFAFGALLYEMATGRRAFAGDSRADTIAKVVKEQPKAPRELLPDLPRDLEKLILRCLRKEPERRFQHMLDVKLELEQIKEDSDSEAGIAPTVPEKKTSRRLAAALASAAAVALAGGLVWRARDPAPSPPRAVHLTTTRGSELTPALSPDGEQVAFSWDGESSAAGVTPDTDIWIKLIGGTEERRVTTGPANDVFPSWSPDGRRIAFLRSTTRYEGAPSTSSPQINGSIHLVSPLGGADRRLGDFRAAFSQLAWSPDGRWLVARRAILENEPRETGGLYLIPVGGGEPRVVTTPTRPAFDNHPAFSPDGWRLAYASCGDYRNPIPPCDVSVVDLDVDFRPQAPPRRLPRRQKGMIIGLAWTRDGRSLVYSAGVSGADELWRADAEGDRPAELIELAGHRAVFPATAASRDRLVFADSLTHSDIYRFEAGRPATVVIGSSFNDYAPSFSPDGRRITWESSRSGGRREIWLADADGTNPVELTQGPGNHQGSPRWSPDGRQIVFDSQGDDGYRDVWAIAVDGGSPRRVTSGPMTEGVPSWSRDGRWIYYREDRPDGRDIWRVPAAGGRPERITHNGGLWARESADGKTLFFTKRDPTSPLFRLPLAGGPERQVIDCVSSRSLADGPDGLYYLGCDEVSLYRLDPDTDRSHLLGRLQGAYGHLAVSPSDGRILFSKTVGEGVDLMMIENFR